MGTEFHATADREGNILVTYLEMRISLLHK